MVAGAVISAVLVLNTDLVWALLAITAAEALTLLVLGREATGGGATVRT
jgi:hypothetical protein